MQFYRRAIKYISRRKGKSLILGCVFAIFIFISLSGIIVIRMMDEMLAELSANSHANIGVFTTDFSNGISESEISVILEIENIGFVNRSNRLTVVFDGFLEIGTGEPVQNAEFHIIGMDDYELDGPFFTHAKQLIEGLLPIQVGDVVVGEAIYLANNWNVGDAIAFINYTGESKNATISGVFRIGPGSERETPFAVYATTEFISELQGGNFFNGGVFYVKNPHEITLTKELVEDFLSEKNYSISISDGLFRQMSAPLGSIQSMAQLILVISALASGLVTSLFLSLWMRERRKEVALLLSLGENKIGIISQRFFEIASLFAVVFLVGLMAVGFLSPVFESLIYGYIAVEMPENVHFAFVLAGEDALRMVGMGATVVFVSVFASNLGLFRVTPRFMLASLD